MDTKPFSMARLTELFDQYMAARDKKNTAEEAFNGLRKPEIPESITNEEDYEFYSGVLKDYKETKDRLHMEMNQAQSEENFLSNDISYFIPLVAVNFKVLYFHEYYYICKHQNNSCSWWDFELCKGGSNEKVE